MCLFLGGTAAGAFAVVAIADARVALRAVSALILGTAIPPAKAEAARKSLPGIELGLSVNVFEIPEEGLPDVAKPYLREVAVELLG